MSDGRTQPPSPEARPGPARPNASRAAVAGRRLAAVLGGVVGGMVVATVVVLAPAATLVPDLVSDAFRSLGPVFLNPFDVLFLLAVPVAVVVSPVGAVWGGLRIVRRSEFWSAPGGGRPATPAGASREVAVACPNCGTERRGRFCGACGQNDRDYRRLFPALSGILAEAFEADSRLRRTLPALFLRPGLLTLEFVRNRRAGYVSPFRLYVFASLLYFLAASWLGGWYQEGAREYLEFAPVVLLCAIPFYAAVLQFVFVGSHFYAAHLVFTLHFLAVALLVLIPFIPWMYGAEAYWQYWAFLFPLAVYLFIALRRVFGRRLLPTLAGWVATMALTVFVYIGVVQGSQIVASLASGKDWDAPFGSET